MLRVRLSTDNYAPHCRKVCKRCCRLLSQIYQLGSHALAPGAKRQTYQINLAVLATAGLFCSAEMTADLQPPIISFIWFAKWRQAGEEEAGLLVAAAGVGHCCLRKLPGTANQKQRAWVRKDSPRQM